MRPRRASPSPPPGRRHVLSTGSGLSPRLVAALAVGTVLGLGLAAQRSLAASAAGRAAHLAALDAALEQRSAQLVEVMKQRDALRSAQEASPPPPLPTACRPDRHAPSLPSAATAAADPDLAAALATVTGGGGGGGTTPTPSPPAVVIAVANRAYASGPGGGLVGAWATAVAATRAPALLFALDEDAAAAATAAGVSAFRVDLPIPPAQREGGAAGAGPPTNHAVSALKYGLVGRVLALGYTALVSDVDVLFLRNPFEEGTAAGAEAAEEGAAAGGGGRATTTTTTTTTTATATTTTATTPPPSAGAGLFPLTEDVAASSDGWDGPSAYGWDDVHDEPGLGWGRYAHSTRLLHLNSGLWAARPTPAAVEAVARVAARVSSEAGWDQAIFNEVLLTPSHGAYTAPGAAVRVLEVERFVNSRVLWSRLGPAAVAAGGVPREASARPTAVHVNYHPDKVARLAAATEFYVGGDVRALEALPVGSEQS